MKVLIVGIIVLALAVAGVSTYLIQTFSGEENIEELQKKAQKPKIRVLVAAKAMAVGEVVRPDALTWQAWVDESLNAQFVAVETEAEMGKRIEEFQGGIVRSAIAEGEPILASKVFKTEKAAFMSGVLKKGMRAVTFTVSPTSASGGFVLPGNRVDILLTHDKVRQVLQKKRGGQPAAPDEPMTVLSQVTETIMRDVLVLAIDMAVGVPPEGANAMPGRTFTLELTPKQAELLITARTMGNLSMVLRPLQAGDEPEAKTSFTSDIEVSPFIRNINAILEAQREGSTKALQQQIQDLEAEKKNLQEAMKEGKSVRAPKQAAIAPPEKKKKVIKIHRSGGTEEVTLKK